jgi:hypothetical protein
LSEPVWVPVDVGLKVTDIVHVPFAGRELGQLFVCANWVLAVMLVTLTEVASVLESVAVCAALVEPTVVDGKVSDAGVRVTLPLLLAPVPVRLRTCGLPEALSETVSEPLRVPAAWGWKLSEMVQLPLAARVAGATGQVVAVWAKSPATAKDEMVSGPAWPLVSVAVWAALVAPMVVEGKESEVGEKVTLPDPAAVAVPERYSCSRVEPRLAFT